MLPTDFSRAVLLLISLALGGCGLVQTVGDGTTSTAKAVFYKQVKTLRLDFTGRASLNTDSAEMNALSVATLVRIYQLRDSRAFEQASYDQMVTAAASALSADLVDEQAVVIKPGGGAQLSVPLHSEARYVAVVALYRQPDLEQNSWRLLVPRDELHPDRARIVELADNTLFLAEAARNKKQHASVED